MNKAPNVHLKLINNASAETKVTSDALKKKNHISIRMKQRFHIDLQREKTSQGMDFMLFINASVVGLNSVQRTSQLCRHNNVYPMDHIR